MALYSNDRFPPDHRDVQDRKYRELELFHRIVEAPEQDILVECRSLGIVTDGVAIVDLRRALLAHHRQLQGL